MNGCEPLDPKMLQALLPFVGESLMVVAVDGTVVANLAPPAGILGHGATLPGENAFTHLHPDDLPKLLELAVGMFDTEPGWQARARVRLQMADGTYRRHEVYISNQVSDPVLNGFVVRTMGLDDESAVDVHAADDLMESMAEAMPVALVLLDPFGKALYANRAAQLLLDSGVDELRSAGITGLQQVVGELCERAGERVVQVAKNNRVLEARLTSHAGVGGRVSSVAVTLADVTERNRAEADLERRATHDHLTGLPNRAAILDLLTTRLASDPSSVSVVYCDLDGFKLVNDRLGHAVGDRVLAHVAGVLRASVRDGDVVGRIGGDEFVFVCDSLDDGQLDAVGTRVTSDLAASLPPDSPPVTASLGLARGRAGDTARDILHRADVSMYAAKRASQAL